MVAYDLRDRELLSVEDMRRVVAYIESFLVRRQLARIPTNALNRLFIQLIERLPQGAGFADTLHRELSRDRLYWPSDDWLRKALRTQPFFHIGRWQQRKLILERLEESFEHPEKIDFQESDLQIEHVLPQTLTPEWREHLRELGQQPDIVHAELVHTLGNLTLTAFNGLLSNNPSSANSRSTVTATSSSTERLSRARSGDATRSSLERTSSPSKPSESGSNLCQASAPKTATVSTGLGSRTR